MTTARFNPPPAVCDTDAEVSAYYGAVEAAHDAALADFQETPEDRR